MLLACPSCHTQYDIGDLPPGSTVRCTCGRAVEVREQKTHEAPIQRCSACGGALPDDARSCPFCGGDVTLGERGWGDACPECMARLVAGASFCSSCGTEIRPRALRKSTGSESCPRCEQPMCEVEIPGGSFVECTGCGGVWLAEKAFERAVEDRERSTAVASYFSLPKAREARERENAIDPGRREVRYLPCPACGQLMNRKNFARSSGVVVDWCKGHGYWFDTHELERIMAWVAGGGLERAREKEIERQKREAEEARRRAERERTRYRGAVESRPVGIRLGSDRTTFGGIAGTLGAFLKAMDELT